MLFRCFLYAFPVLVQCFANVFHAFFLLLVDFRVVFDAGPMFFICLFNDFHMLSEDVPVVVQCVCDAVSIQNKACRYTGLCAGAYVSMHQGTPTYVHPCFADFIISVLFWIPCVILFYSA